jgi:6-phosphogluconolactonase
MYVATRREPGVHCFRRGATGDTQWDSVATTSLDHDPCFIGLDRSGRFLLASYYHTGGVSVHEIGNDGAVLADSATRYETDTNAHMCATDPGNRFVFVPHTGPNFIARFRFDADTGAMVRDEGAEPFCPPGAGPRHMVFHPTGRWAFTSNELGSSVSVYAYDEGAGNLRFLASHSTLPDGFSGDNTCGQIHLSPDAKTLCVSNRGHDSIAYFAFDPETSTLHATGHVPTGPVPRAFCLDGTGRFVCAASQEDGTLTVAAIPGRGEVASILNSYSDILSETANPLWVCVTPEQARPR